MNSSWLYFSTAFWACSALENPTEARRRHRQNHGRREEQHQDIPKPKPRERKGFSRSMTTLANWTCILCFRREKTRQHLSITSPASSKKCLKSTLVAWSC
eukprot:749933-Hanusia_phi.AAC.6